MGIIEGDAEATEIQVKQVDAETLKKIVDYLKAHEAKPHKEINKPLRSVKVQGKDSFIINEDKNIQQFDRDLLEELLGDKRMLFKVILGANYMDVQGLLHLGCAGVASLIKGKSPEEIKVILKVDEDDDKVVGDVTLTEVLRRNTHTKEDFKDNLADKNEIPI